MVTRRIAAEANERLHKIREHMDHLDTRLGLWRDITIHIPTFNAEQAEQGKVTFQLNPMPETKAMALAGTAHFPLESLIRVAPGPGPLRRQFEDQYLYCLNWSEAVVRELDIYASRIPWSLEFIFHYGKESGRDPFTMGLVWDGGDLEQTNDYDWKKRNYWSTHS